MAPPVNPRFNHPALHWDRGRPRGPRRSSPAGVADSPATIGKQEQFSEQMTFCDALRARAPAVPVKARLVKGCF
jgi:hypothetical protein